jgi:hypothetical protein
LGTLSVDHQLSHQVRRGPIENAGRPARPRRCSSPGSHRNTYRKRVPLQNGSSRFPRVAPCDRFSELGTYRTSAFQPRGLRPRSSPGPRARPTAGGYSSRSKPSRVGISRSTRSRRASAPRRFTPRRRGQPRRSAPRKWRRTFGYLRALNTMRCTPLGFTHAAVPASVAVVVPAGNQTRPVRIRAAAMSGVCIASRSAPRGELRDQSGPRGGRLRARLPIWSVVMGEQAHCRLGRRAERGPAIGGTVVMACVYEQGLRREVRATQPAAQESRVVGDGVRVLTDERGLNVTAGGARPPPSPMSRRGLLDASHASGPRSRRGRDAQRAVTVARTSAKASGAVRNGKCPAATLVTSRNGRASSRWRSVGIARSFSHTT